MLTNVYILGGEDDTWQKTKPLVLFGPDSKTFVEIYDLDETKEYEMATIAVNEKGESGRSNIKTVTPGAKEEIIRKYYAIYGNMLILTWFQLF